AGNLYIADGSNVRVRKITPNGMIGTIAGGGTLIYAAGRPATEAQLFHLSGIASDAAGNLYIVQSPSTIYKVAANGVISNFGSGNSVAVDAAGTVYTVLGSQVAKITQVAVFPSNAKPPGI